MAGIERIPNCGVRFAVESGKDDSAPGKPGHRRHQGAGRRHASGRAGEDHLPLGWSATPGFDAVLDKPVAPLGGADPALLLKHRGPGIGDDAEEVERGLPVRGKRFGHQFAEPVEAKTLCLDLIEEAPQLEGQACDAGGIPGPALSGTDQLGQQELAAERRDRGRQVERRGRDDIVGLEFLVETDIADRHDGWQQERGLRAGAQHGLAERPGRPSVGQQHGRPCGWAPLAVRQQSAGERVEEGNPGGDREDARPRGIPARHPTWKSCAPGRPDSRSSAVLSAAGVPIWNHSPSCTMPNRRAARSARS